MSIWYQLFKSMIRKLFIWYEPHEKSIPNIFNGCCAWRWSDSATQGGVSSSRYRQRAGPDSRNDPLAIGSDTILWSWSADRIPQTPITIGSSDRENTKPDSLLPIESWHRHSLGNLELKLRGRDWMKNVRLMISIHDVTMGGVATSFMSTDTRASCTHTVFAHDTTRFGHIFDRYVYVINVIENIQTVDTWQTMFQ